MLFTFPLTDFDNALQWHLTEQVGAINITI